ncbi:MAG: hypothetical protein ACP5D8_07190 [Fidelibacterota bacterium]
MRLTLENDADNRLEIGKVLLSQVGKELVSVCRVPGVEGFEEYVKDKWNKHLPEKDKVEHDAAQEGESAGAPSPPVS